MKEEAELDWAQKDRIRYLDYLNIISIIKFEIKIKIYCYFLI